MKVNVWLCIGLLSSYSVQLAEFSKVELDQLKQERTTNLIIINDPYESYQTFPNSVVFPWSKISGSAVAMTHDLLESLADNQLVLCTKTLWHNLQFYAHMWENFVTKTDNELWEIYKNYTGVATLNFFEKRKFLSHAARYIPIIKQYHNMYQSLNASIAHNSDRLDDAFMESLHDQFLSDANVLLDALNKDENLLVNNIEDLVQIYTCYQLILSLNYTCKAVNDSMILFIPENQLNKTTQSHLFNSLKLGLSLFNLPDYPFKIQLSADTSLRARAWNVLKSGQDFISLNHGKILVDALKALAVSHKSMPHDMVMPLFNIFLCGHGSNYNTSAAISTKLVGPKADTSSTFLKFLDVLQYSYQTKSLAIGTCFAGGKNIKEMLEAEFSLRSRKLEKYSFPIIILGVVYTVTYGNPKPSGFGFNEKDVHVRQQLYAQAPGYYSSYFKALNAVDNPDYLAAINHIAHIYKLDSTNDVLMLKQVSNYLTIKFPHTEWFTPPTFKKYVINLPQIAMSTRTQEIKIHPDTKLILVSANKIFPTLQFNDVDLLTDTLESESSNEGSNSSGQQILSEDESSLNSAETLSRSDQESCLDFSCDQELLLEPKNIYLLLGSLFMPANYVNQNYVFDHIEFLNPVSLDFVMHKFFAVENILEPINIVIKKLTINRGFYEDKKPIIYKDICIFIYKKFNIFKKAQNGFMYKAPDNKIYLASWNHDEPFPAVPKKLSFEVTRAKGMLEHVETQAVKNLKSFANLENMLQAKQTNALPTRVVQSQNLAATNK